jgi:hypothetical protein
MDDVPVALASDYFWIAGALAQATNPAEFLDSLRKLEVAL